MAGQRAEGGLRPSLDEARERVWWCRASTKDRWEKSDCAWGIAVRGGLLRAHCSSRDCSRRIRVDLEWLIARGFGDSPIAVIQRAYECARLPCALSWSAETYAQGVPLTAYAGVEGAKGLVACRVCRRELSLGVAPFIDALLKARRANPKTLAWRLDHTVTGACKACGATAGSVCLMVPGQTIKARPGQD